jgi:DNA-binding transcriptional regulator of glucitol operon
MKIDHAAALALVGWYLMTPHPDSSGKLNFKAPLSQWNQIGAFANAATCNQERESELDLAEKGIATVKKEIEALPDTGKRPLREVSPKVYEDESTVSAFALKVRASQCIASDDPRLKVAK